MTHHYARFGDLSVLDSVDLPMWVFDVDRHEVWWGNSAALDFWHCATLDELLARDYSSDSATVKERLQALVAETPVGETTKDTWTLYPADEPVTVDLRLTHVLIGDEKRDALLIKATPKDRSGMDASDMRIAEATRYSSILISYFALDGTSVFMNPRASSVYSGNVSIAGSAAPTFFERFVDPAEARAMFGECMSEGELSQECRVVTATGERLHRIGLRLARDPITGDRNVLVVEEDVTAARTAERALAEKEVLLQDAVEALSDAFLLTDKNGRIVMVNKKFKEQYAPLADSIVPGVPYENVLRHAASLHLIPDQVGREEEWVQERLEKHFNPGDGYEQQMSDGSWMRVRESKTSTGGVAGIRVDITELKRAQNAVTERERLLNDALESLDDAFLVTDKDGIIIAANSKYHEIYPMVADIAIPGAHYRDVLRVAAKSGINTKSVDREDEWVEERYERHRNPGPAYEQQLSNGRWYRIHEAKTSAGGTAGVRMDITDLKEAETAKADSERILVDAIESLQDAFVLTDKDDRIIIANNKIKAEFPEVEEFLVPGALFKDVLTAFAHSGTPTGAFGREDEWIEERMEQRRNPLQNFEMELANGKWIRIHETKTSDGGIASFRIDISEIKQAQQVAIESESLLRDAIDSLDDPFLLTDADDCVVLANSKYSEVYGFDEELLKPGTPYRTLLEKATEIGMIAGLDEETKACWIKERMQRHLSPSRGYEQQLSNGRWYRMHESRTSTGGIAGIRVDITETKQAEAARADSERILKDAVDSLGDGFILTDAEDRVVVANQKFKEFYKGIEELVAPGTPFADLVAAAADRGVHDGPIAATLTTKLGKGRDVIEPYERKMSDGRWLRVLEQRTSDGGIAGTRVDITELKETQHALIESERILTDAIESLGEAFILTDADDKVVIANQRYKEFYKGVAGFIKPGTPFVEVLRESARLGIQPTQVGREELWVQERLEKHLNPGPAFEQYLADGRWIRAVERRTSTGGIAGIRSDITELKRTEEALARSQGRLQDAVESLGDAFILTDSHDCVVIANEKYKEYYHVIADVIEPGVPFIDLMRLACERRQLPAAFGREDEWLEERMAAHRNPSGVIEQHLADGRWLRVVERKTASGGIAGSRVDITEIKRAQQEAEEANRAKTEFLSSMSHELRTPLNSVMGFSQVLAYDKENPLNERQSAAVGMIRRSGQHLLNLINEVLDLSRIETGNTEIELRNVNAGDVLEECLAVAQAMASERRIVIEDRTREIQQPMVRADMLRMKQVLLNLLSNAVKYNQLGGRVIVTAEPRDQNVLRVSVIDDGPGIEPDDHHKVFSPFDRLGRESQNVEGTGVGLTISKSLIELMGGKIGFSSKEGSGSTFWFELPIVDLSGIEEGAHGNIASKPKHWSFDGVEYRTVLYVEDNKANISLMEQIFEMIDGVDLVVAQDAQSGLVTASEVRPDVVLMDIQLPGMSGIEAAKALRSLPGLGKVPVIAVTAAAMKSDRDRASSANFAAYVTKPINIEELVSVLAMALDQE